MAADLAKCKEHMEVAYVQASFALADLLPAGPDAKKPPPDWPHWQLAYALMDAKLKLTTALRDLAER